MCHLAESVDKEPDIRSTLTIVREPDYEIHRLNARPQIQSATVTGVPATM